MNLALIVNPAAGRGRGRKAYPVIARHLERLGHAHQAFFSRGPGHVTELAREVSSLGADAVVACGGDGTFHEMINGLDGHRGTVGLIPCGTGDDLAAGIGIPRDWWEACRLLDGGRSRRLDLARAGERVYACIAGAGFDAMVARRANKKTRILRGGGIYIWSVVRTLAGFRPVELAVEGDGLAWSGLAMFAVVANAPAYGGGMRIAPMALMDDGLLDLIVVEAIPRLELLRVFPRVFSGSHMSHPAVRHYRSARIRLSSPDGLELFADGEYVARLPLTIEVLPGALTVLAP